MKKIIKRFILIVGIFWLMVSSYFGIMQVNQKSGLAFSLASAPIVILALFLILIFFLGVIQRILFCDKKK